MKRRGDLGLLFWLIIQAWVTAVSVIKPVMMIWFRQAWRIKKNALVSMSESGESVRLCYTSASLWGFSQSMPGASQAFPHCTQRGCGGAKHGLPTEATVTLKRGVGPSGQLKGHNETRLAIILCQLKQPLKHSSTEYQKLSEHWMLATKAWFNVWSSLLILWLESL